MTARLLKFPKTLIMGKNNYMTRRFFLKFQIDYEQ